MILLNVYTNEVKEKKDDFGLSFFWFGPSRKCYKIACNFIDEGIRRSQEIIPKGYKIQSIQVEYDLYGTSGSTGDFFVSQYTPSETEVSDDEN